MAMLRYVIRRGRQANDRWDLLWESPAIVTNVKITALVKIEFGAYGGIYPVDEYPTVGEARFKLSKLWGVPHNARAMVMTDNGMGGFVQRVEDDYYLLAGGETLRFIRL